MSILPAQTIWQLCHPPALLNFAPMIHPVHDRSEANGMTFGLGPAGYDIRVAEEIELWPINLENLVNNWLAKRVPWFFKHRPSFVLASTPEHFDLPNDITFKVEDKSSFARKGLSVFNTTAEPGWRGWLTLELKNHGEEVIRIPAGSPIAAVCFERLEAPTIMPYAGKYQDQRRGPQPAIDARELDA